MAKVLNISNRDTMTHWVFDTTRIDRMTPWGNPFMIGKDGSRKEVCSIHKRWIRDWIEHKKLKEINVGTRTYSNKWVVEHIHQLKGLNLACWCAPEQCHGDFLLELANKE